MKEYYTFWDKICFGSGIIWLSILINYIKYITYIICYKYILSITYYIKLYAFYMMNAFKSFLQTIFRYSVTLSFYCPRAHYGILETHYLQHCTYWKNLFSFLLDSGCHYLLSVFLNSSFDLSHSKYTHSLQTTSSTLFTMILNYFDFDVIVKLLNSAGGTRSNLIFKVIWTGSSHVLIQSASGTLRLIYFI